MFKFISDESCNQCNFEEHSYYGIRKLSKPQFFMLADKFLEIKKVNAPDIKYGRCLSENQIRQIKEDLETADNRVLTGIISGINNPFGYYFNE